MKKRQILVALFLFISLVIGICFSYKHFKDYREVKRQKILLEKRRISWRALKQTLEDEVAKFKGEAGIVIKDLEMNWEILVDKDKLFPSASLVKIPIMTACFNAAWEKKIKLEDTIKLKSSDKVSGSGILKDMQSGKEFSVAELIGLMISDSDNTATNMLIDLLGFDYSNNFFKVFGLKNTNLVRKMMDFRDRREGVENYTTAEDVAYIFEKFYRREFLNSVISERCLKLLKLQRINDRIPAKLPLNLAIAHKTGLERNVCHDAGIVFTDRGDFLICVLTKHKDKTAKLAKEFIAQIAFLAYKYSLGF